LSFSFVQTKSIEEGDGFSSNVQVGHNAREESTAVAESFPEEAVTSSVLEGAAPGKKKAKRKPLRSSQS